MHNNFLVDRGGKMSKSKGGFATLQSLVDRGVHPLAYRLLCLSAHYRSELEFSPESLAAALTRLKRLAIAIAALRDKADMRAGWLRVVAEIDASKGADLGYARAVLEAGLPEAARALIARFDAAVSADLNVPQALPLVDEALALGLSPDDTLRLLAHFDLLLGLDLIGLDRRALSLRPADAALTDAEVEAALEDRAAARAAKDWATSDAIRDSLAAAGVELMDGDALRWEWKPAL